MTTEQMQGWYYVDGASGRKQGPLPPPEFKALADRGVIKGDTPVWVEGYPEWVPASQVAGLVTVAAPPTVPAAQGAPVAADPQDNGVVPEQAPSTAVVPAPVGSGDEAVPAEELKPRKGSFLFPRIVTGVVLSVVLAVAVCIGLAVAEIAPLLGLLVLVPGVALTICAAAVAYRKERYELQDATVVCHRGSLVSDQTTELEIRNITHVKVKLPWLRYRFFRVGDVIIESAGTAQPVVLRAVRQPEEIYGRMRERMKRNGYDLTQAQLLHEEQPAMLGVLSECLGMGVATAVAILLGLPTIMGLAAEVESIGLTGLLLVLGLLFVVGAVGFLVVHFLDLRRRTYRVYNDVVVYEEGFLTRNNAFIPFENIADAATKRSFIDQILNLYDVVVSCQGSSAEIKFRRLRQGMQLSHCIDQLVVEAGLKPSPAVGASGAVDEETGSAGRTLPRRRDEPALVAPGDAWIADLKMSTGRVLVPLLLLLPLVPIWIAATIQAAIKLFSTRYAVRPGSIRHSYRFLTTHDREFAYDKITGLVIKENLWDRLFGTVTLRFWSIGSGQVLDLAHVRRKDIDFAAVSRQIGIPPASARPYEVQTSFGGATWIRARLFRLVFVLLAVAGLIVAGVQTGESLFFWLIAAPVVVCLGGLGYAWAFYARQRLRFHDHHVEAEQGVITRHRYYARYRNVKKTVVTRYPGGEEGNLQIFVAGEQQLARGGEKKGQSKVTVPCSFTLGFLPQAAGQGRLLDDILCGRVDPGPEATAAEPLDLIVETKRSVGNSLVPLILLSVVAFPMIVLLPFTIPLTIVAVRRYRYRLEAGRVATTWGVLYRKVASIVLDRVDSLQQRQGMLNKTFKNGNVSIMTAGSSKPDLVMPAARDFQVLYQEIRKLSQRG